MPPMEESTQTRTPVPGAELLGGQAPGQWPAMLLAILLFAALSFAAAVASGGFLEADACTHYLYARFALSEYHYLVNMWGRPFCTAIYAVPAYLGGRLAVRATSLLLALAIGLISWRIAKNQGYRQPALALIFLLGQPILFLHSFSELTELPFAFLVALAFWAYQGRQWLAMTLAVSLMPTARPEGFGVLALAAVALLLHRRWRWIPLLFLPLAIWSFAGWYILSLEQPWYLKWWQWLPKQWPYAGISLYDPGSPLHFVLRLPAITSPIAFPAVVFGIALSFALRRPEEEGEKGRGRDGENRRNGETANRREDCSPNRKSKIKDQEFPHVLFGPDHRLRCQWLIALIPLSVLLVHSFLYWRGLMASNGELRYLLVAAPMWALLAARGWEWGFARIGWGRPLVWAGLGLLFPVLVNGLIYKVVPLQMTGNWIRAQEVAHWYNTSPLPRQYTRLIATDIAVCYFLDLSPSDPERTVEYKLKTTGNPPPGVMIIWDPMYGVYNSDNERSFTAQQLIDHGWLPAKVFADPPPQPGGSGPVDKLARTIQQEKIGDWIVFLSPLDISGQPTPMDLVLSLPKRQ